MKTILLYTMLLMGYAVQVRAVPFVPNDRSLIEIHDLDDSTFTSDYNFTVTDTLSFCPPGGGRIDYERTVIISAQVKVWDLRGFQPRFNEVYGPDAPSLNPAIEALILGTNAYAFDTAKIETVWCYVLYQICYNMCESEFGSLENECLSSPTTEIKEDGPILIKSPYGTFLLNRTTIYKCIRTTKPPHGP